MGPVLPLAHRADGQLIAGMDLVMMGGTAKVSSPVIGLSAPEDVEKLGAVCPSGAACLVSRRGCSVSAPCVHSLAG